VKRNEIHVRSLATREIVHSVEITFPCSERKLDKIIDGLTRNMDLEKFFIDDSVVRTAIRRKKG